MLLRKKNTYNNISHQKGQSKEMVLGKHPPGKKSPADPKPIPIPNLTLTLPLTPHGWLFSGVDFFWRPKRYKRKDIWKDNFISSVNHGNRIQNSYNSSTTVLAANGGWPPAVNFTLVSEVSTAHWSLNIFREFWMQKGNHYTNIFHKKDCDK